MNKACLKCMTYCQQNVICCQQSQQQLQEIRTIFSEIFQTYFEKNKAEAKVKLGPIVVNFPDTIRYY